MNTQIIIEKVKVKICCFAKNFLIMIGLVNYSLLSLIECLGLWEVLGQSSALNLRDALRREREGGREGERYRKKEKERQAEREKERKKDRKKERERE
jgi:hypothetical protein